MIWNRMHRAVRAVLLGADPLQHRHAAVALVQDDARRTCWLLFVIALVVNVGMWLERFVIVVTSLHRDFLPSSWGMYYPTSGTGRRSSARSVVPGAAVPVHSLPADDFDLRDAHAAAAGARSRGVRRAMRTEYVEDRRDSLRPDGRIRTIPTRWWRPRAGRARTGYRQMDAYTPFPIEELAEALDLHHNPLPLIVLIGGIVGRRAAGS